MRLHKQKNRIPKASFIILIVAFLLFVFVIILLPKFLNQPATENESTESIEDVSSIVESNVNDSNILDFSDSEGTSEGSESEEQNDLLVFPLTLNDGMLEIENTFLYDGLNPDCKYQEGSDIAAITVKNISNEYLSNASITLQTNSGDNLMFVVKDLPIGTSAMVFSSENYSLENDTGYIEATCEASFDTEASLCEDKISVSVTGNLVTLQNNTDIPLNEIVVYCHSVLDGQYFGGITYNYTISDLPAHETRTLEAIDSILGFVEVVRVIIQ